MFNGIAPHKIEASILNYIVMLSVKRYKVVRIIS